MKIFVISGYSYWGDFIPTDLEKGERQIGGGETAMIQVSKNLARLGNEVTVFHDIAKSGRYDGVDWLPQNLFVPLVCQMEHDVLVSWDYSHAFRFADRAKVRVMAFQINDTFIGPFDHTIDLYMHPSKWHGERYKGIYPEITASKQRYRVTNGIDGHRYVQDGIEREPLRMIYSSSPDRGLHHLLRMWPKITEEVPEAALEIFYEIENWRAMIKTVHDIGVPTPSDVQEEEVGAAYEEPPSGVTFHGGVGQARLAREQLASSVMAYPCDPVAPTEGFSMTCLEAVTAGLSLITTDADALGELWADAPGVTILPLPIDEDLWISTIVNVLKNEIERTPRVPLRYTWETIAQLWMKELDQCLHAKS